MSAGRRARAEPKGPQRKQGAAAARRAARQDRGDMGHRRTPRARTRRGRTLNRRRAARAVQGRHRAPQLAGGGVGWPAAHARGDGGPTPQRCAFASVGCGPSSDLLAAARSTWLTDLEGLRDDGRPCDAAEVAGAARARERSSGGSRRAGCAPGGGAGPRWRALLALCATLGRVSGRGAWSRFSR